MSGTPEQEARDILERMGIENAQSFSAGDVVELANLVASVWELSRDKERLDDATYTAYEMGHRDGEES